MEVGKKKKRTTLHETFLSGVVLNFVVRYFQFVLLSFGRKRKTSNQLSVIILEISLSWIKNLVRTVNRQQVSIIYLHKRPYLIRDYVRLFRHQSSTEVTLCFILSQAGTESTSYSSLQTLAKTMTTFSLISNKIYSSLQNLVKKLWLSSP